MKHIVDLDVLGIGMANPAMFENRAYADGWNSLYSILQQAPVVDAEPVVRCKDCVFFRERHVLTSDGQRKSYAEMPPEAFGLLGDGNVTGEYGINVGSQCLVDCNIGYSDDKTVFRGPDEFCARAVKKMDGGAEDGQ